MSQSAQKKSVPDPIPLKQELVPNKRYKTELCRYYQLNKLCLTGHLCQFAHGVDELRTFDGDYFIHEDPLPVNALTVATTFVKKSSLCMFGTIQACQKGEQCQFVHVEGPPQSQQPQENLSSLSISFNPPPVQVGSNLSMTPKKPDLQAHIEMRTLLYVLTELKQLFSKDQALNHKIEQAMKNAENGDRMTGMEIIKCIGNDNSLTPNERNHFIKIQRCSVVYYKQLWKYFHPQ